MGRFLQSLVHAWPFHIPSFSNVCSIITSFISTSYLFSIYTWLLWSCLVSYVSYPALDSSLNTSLSYLLSIQIPFLSLSLLDISPFSSLVRSLSYCSPSTHIFLQYILFLYPSSYSFFPSPRPIFSPSIHGSYGPVSFPFISCSKLLSFHILLLSSLFLTSFPIFPN
jgi:hypothetical protein